MKYVTGVVVLILLLVGGWFLLSSEQNGAETNEVSESVEYKASVTIATSFYPLEFVLERITGDLGAVGNIGANRDPHDFEPSARNIRALQEADLVVLQGADYEPWGDAVIEQLEERNIPVVLATAGLDLHEGGHDHEEEGGHEEDDEHEDENEHEDEREHGAYDPHTWLDPVRFSETVANLTEAIVVLDPQNAATYEANAAALQAELAALNTEYESRLSSCGLDEVITSHDAFGYLADRYGFEIHAIAGISTQDLPSAKVLAALREEAEEGVGAILLEENSVTAYGETLARETGLKTLGINPIAFVIPTGEDYLTIMRANLDTFATALSCDA